MPRSPLSSVNVFLHVVSYAVLFAVNSAIMFTFLHLVNLNLIPSWYLYSASSSPLLLGGVPDCSIDTLSELIPQSTAGNCK